jgi:NAD(P)H-hydrate repair Nnr-like enzyme with NAD(P)H-hydrate dehydratase domain
MATAFLGQPHQLLRSALLACYAKGLTGTVAADQRNRFHPPRDHALEGQINLGGPSLN